jgi:hypothetical protein
MKTEMHRLVSASVMWRISSDKPEKSTTAEQVFVLTCQCGAITEYTWRLGATSYDELETMTLGLIATASQEIGPPVVRLHSRVSSSDLPMN